MMPPDDIPVPHAVESDSESVWQEFQESIITLEQQFADTIPAPLYKEPTPASYVPVISPEEDPFK